LPLSKAKGQHFLHNKGVLKRIIEVSDVRPVDTVYEVGCGTGELTMELLRRAREVHTVDVETRMVHETESRAAAAGYNNLKTSVGDVLKIDMPRRFDICVSNLPYQISSPFIFKLLRRLSQGRAWRSAILMVQREFAERLLADPGEEHFSRLALNVRLFARVVRLFDVKPGSFTPQPQVHSTVIRLEPRLPPPRVDFGEWDALIRIIFSRRRKTLRAQFRRRGVLIMLEQNYKIRCSLLGTMPAKQNFPSLVESVLEEEGMAQQRAFAMDIDDLHQLLQAFNRRGICFINVQGALDEESDDEYDGDDEASGPHDLLRPDRRIPASPAGIVVAPARFIQHLPRWGMAVAQKELRTQWLHKWLNEEAPTKGS
jgi:18S rRNA (adenine1779-N6/adenine1780-N6)-dimethyltransferase